MTHDLKWSLEDLADADYTEAPPSTIDIAKARHDGRRKMVTARLAPVGTGIAVVAVCGLAVSGIAGGNGASSAAPNAGSGNTPPQSAAAGSSFTTGTDPLLTHASYTWMPAGWVAGTKDGGPDYGDHNAIQAPGNPAAKENPAAFVNLQVTATELPLIEGSTTETASLTGSQKAFWIHMPNSVGFDPKDLALVWQTSSGAWVNLYSTHLGGGDAAKATLKSIAEGVALGDKPVPLPVHIEGLPKSLTPHQTELNTPALNGTGTGWDVQLMFNRADQAAVLVSVTPTGQPTAAEHAGDGNSVPPPPSGTPKTQPAKECKDDNGLHICVTDYSGDSGQAKDLLERITSLGTDQANWTTHVLN